MIRTGAAPRPAAAAGRTRHDRQIRVVITGKGGAGKTTITALLAYHFSRRGISVLAVDGDPQQNLAATLGIEADAVRIVPVSGHPHYLREKTGAGTDGRPGDLLTLNPDVSDVVDRFAVPVSENLRLLVMGGVRQAGSGCLCPEYTLLAAILRQIPAIPERVVLLDTPAGLEHFGRAVADGFSSALVVAEPTYNALSVAHESAVLARQLGIDDVILVLNKIRNPAEGQRAAMRAGGQPDLFSGIVQLAFDQEIALAEPSVVPVLRDNPGGRADIRILADTVAA